MDRIKKLDEWLYNKIEDKDIPQYERVVYCKVLDYIERNLI